MPQCANRFASKGNCTAAFPPSYLSNNPALPESLPFCFRSWMPLSDLKGLCLHIHCRCGRILAKRVEDFIEAYGDIEQDELAKRMRCIKCGARGPSLSPWTGGPFPPLRG